MMNSAITCITYCINNIVYNEFDKQGRDVFDNDEGENDTDNSKECVYYKINSPKCPRCGGEDFLELEQHRVDYSEEFEENKTIYTKPLKCLRCDFEFVPLREE